MQAGAIEELLLWERGTGGLDEDELEAWWSGDADKCTRRVWMSLVGDASHSPI